MANTTLATLLSICGLAVFGAYEVVLRRRHDVDAATWKGDSDNRGSTRLILAAYAATIIVDIALSRSSVGDVGPLWRWVGVAMLSAGLALRAWAMSTLGSYYTRTLRTVERQHVVDDGPYRLIRHPGYSGSLLIWVGYALGIGSWIAAAATVVLLGAVYLWRVDAEEAL